MDAAVLAKRRHHVVAPAEQRAELLQRLVAGARRGARVASALRELERRQEVTIVVRRAWISELARVDKTRQAARMWPYAAAMTF